MLARGARCVSLSSVHHQLLHHRQRLYRLPSNDQQEAGGDLLFVSFHDIMTAAPGYLPDNETVMVLLLR